MHCLECIIAVMKWNLYTVRKLLALRFAGHYQRGCDIKASQSNTSKQAQHSQTTLCFWVLITNKTNFMTVYFQVAQMIFSASLSYAGEVYVTWWGSLGELEDNTFYYTALVLHFRELFDSSAAGAQGHIQNKPAANNHLCWWGMTPNTALAAVGTKQQLDSKERKEHLSISAAAPTTASPSRQAVVVGVSVTPT